MYIINPAWIYLIEQLDRIHSLCIILAILMIIGWFITGIHQDNDTGDVHFKSAHNVACMVLVMLFITLSCAIPTRETGYKMLIAGTITTDVLKDGHELVKEDLSSAMDKVKDSVIDIMKEAKQ